jgi:hypothetical protein
MVKCKQIVAVFVLSLSTASLATAEQRPVSPSEVPQVVANAVSARYPSAQSVQFAKEVARGTTMYEVHWVAAGASTRLCVNPSGSVEREQQTISAAGLPAVVQHSLAAAGFELGQVAAAQRTTRFGQSTRPTYQIVVTVRGTPHEVTFDAAGNLVLAQPSSSCVGEPGAASDRVALGRSVWPRRIPA